MNTHHFPFNIFRLAATLSLTLITGVTAANDQEKAKTGPGSDIIPTPIEAQQKNQQRPTYQQPADVSNQPPAPTTLPLKPVQGETIVFIGNSLAERMQHYGHFETLLYKAFPNSNITFRNMGFPAHTPGFRPEAGQPDPWAFPGGDKFHPEINAHYGIGHYPKPDEWLTTLKADTIVAFFGFNESFAGIEGVDNFKAELAAFVDHTLASAYNGHSAPRLILATPIAIEQHPGYHLPDADDRNTILAAYADAVKAVAQEKNVGFIDLFTHTRSRFQETASTGPLTINGVHLGDIGYQELAPVLFEQLFGKTTVSEKIDDQLLREAIYDKSGSGATTTACSTASTPTANAGPPMATSTTPRKSKKSAR